MTKPLIIIDSEVKAKTLHAQFENEIDTLLVLSPPMKVIYKSPEDKLKKAKPLFDVAPTPQEKPFVDKLLGYLDRDIYLAFDCDQRGEYWSWMISKFLLSSTKGANIPRRLHLTGLSRDELREAFRLVEPVEDEKATSFYIRSAFNSYLVRHLERLLGTQAGPGNLPLNFHSLTTLFMLADREMEIQAFIPALKWQIRVKLAGPDGEFTARLEEVYEFTDDGFLKNGEQGKEVINCFKDKTFTVTGVDRTDIAIQPPLPYRIAELLQDAFILYGMQPQKVLEVVRRLFSGVEINGALVGLITSIAPVENCNTTGLIEKIRKRIAETRGEEALGDGEGHDNGGDFILPTCPEICKDDLKQILNKDECDLYGLIHGRAFASQMKKAVGETIDVELQAGEECFFRASRQSITDKGFLSTYYGYHDRELLQPSALANVKEGQTVENLQIIPEQTSGFPPEYYTFESLFSDLADFSISLEPSVILMLQSMINGDYLAITPDGYLRCKENVAKVIKTINRAFPSMTGINLSAYLEQTVEEARSGRKPLDIALRQFDQTIMMQGNVLTKVTVPSGMMRTRPQTSRRIIKAEAQPAAPSPAEETPRPGLKAVEPKAVEGHNEQAAESVPPLVEEVGAVPTEEKVVAQTGAHEEAAAPEEAVTEPPEEIVEAEAEQAADEEEIVAEDIEEAVSLAPEPEAETAQEIFEQPQEEEVAVETEVLPPQPAVMEEKTPAKDCPDCGRVLLLKEDRFGKFWYCSGHPECRHSESYEKGAGPEMACPICDIGNVITKRTPTGKTFYVCPEQDCEFMAWSQPHAVPCQACNSPFLVEKKNISGKRYLRCPRAGCNYMQPMPGEEGEGFDPAAVPRKKVRVRRVKGGAGGGKKRKVRVVRRKK